MSDRVRLFFDECCLGKRAVDKLEVLIGLSDERVELKHLLSAFPPGTLDREWIPRVASEGWTVITSDRGKSKPNRGKLPEICRRYHVTHIVFSRSMHKRRDFEKVAAIMGLWSGILAAAREDPRGNG